MRTALALFLMVLPYTASSATISVSYLVDRTTFKKKTSAGDPLTFELSESPLCTSPTVSAVVKAGSSSLVVELVQQQTVRGQKPKPKDLLRLTTSIASVDSSGALYVRVVGDGVVGIPSDCQAQGAAPLGVPGPPGPQGPQ